MALIDQAATELLAHLTSGKVTSVELCQAFLEQIRAHDAAVKAFLRFVSGHTFVGFAWYRIVFGVLVLITAYTGTVHWVD